MEGEVVDRIVQMQETIAEYRRFACAMVSMITLGHSIPVVKFDDDKNPYLNEIGKIVGAILDREHIPQDEESPSDGLVS